MRGGGVGTHGGGVEHGAEHLGVWREGLVLSDDKDLGVVDQNLVDASIICDTQIPKHDC